jgi:diguanylate cyclase (GGDEF)-like protein
VSRIAVTRWVRLAAWGPPIAAGVALLFIGYVLSIDGDVIVPPLGVSSVFLALAILAECVPVPLTRGGPLTFAPLFVFPAIVFLGPVQAALVSVAGIAIGNGLLRRRPVQSIVFDAGQRTLSVLLAGAVWTILLQGHASFGRPAFVSQSEPVLAAFLGTLLAYALPTSLLVNAHVAASRGQALGTVLRAGVWQASTNMVLGASGLVISLLLSGQLSPIDIKSLIPVLLGSFIVLLYAARRQAAERSGDVHEHEAFEQTLARVEALQSVTKEQLQRMQAFERISERINSQRDLDAVFDLIAESARDVLGADRCALFLGSTDLGIVRTFARRLPDDYLQAAADAMRKGQGLGSLTVRLKEPVVVPDALADPRADRVWAQRVGHRTLAAFPLVFRDTAIGALALYHDTIHPYGQDEIALGAAFANQAAIAVQNTRLLQEAEHRAHQLGLLNRIVTRVAALLRPEDLFEALVEELHTTLNYPFVAILTAQEDHLHVDAYRGYADFPRTVPVTQGVIGRVARTRQPSLVEDVSRDPDYYTVDSRVTQESCVPILQAGRLVGVINIEVIEPTLTPADLDLLVTLAGQVVAAMRNGALFAEVRQARDELQALYESAQALSSSLELSAVLEAVVAVTCRRFGYDRGAIVLLDPAGDLVVHATHGTPAPAGRIPIGEGAEGRAAYEARAVLVADVSQDSPRGPVSLLVGATLAVPLFREGKVIGVFSVGRTRPGALGERDQRVLTTLAGYAAVAIENARLYEHARYLAITDGLTGLLNHRAFRQALDQELERTKRYALPLSMIMLEIDKFKRYNDTYGHLRGDEVLRLVARVLEKEHRQVDVIARYGGDEFMIFLPHTAKEAAGEVAERIRRAVESTPYVVDTQVTSVTLSVGVATYPEDGDTTDALVDAADRRMYAAKESGGNSVTLTTTS